MRALPAKVTVRPTGARVREAIFSRLYERVVGARVLDLFAGSGALSFEALSRGAAHVIAVDHDAAVVRHLEAQADDFDCRSEVELIRGDAPQVLRGGRGARRPIDLVFIDPPYADVELIDAVLAGLAAGGWLAADAEIIVERARIRGSVAVSDLPAGFRTVTSRDYGQTCVEFLRGPSASR